MFICRYLKLVHGPTFSKNLSLVAQIYGIEKLWATTDFMQSDFAQCTPYFIKKNQIKILDRSFALCFIVTIQTLAIATHDIITAIDNVTAATDDVTHIIYTLLSHHNTSCYQNFPYCSLPKIEAHGLIIREYPKKKPTGYNYFFLQKILSSYNMHKSIHIAIVDDSLNHHFQHVYILEAGPFIS